MATATPVSGSTGACESGTVRIADRVQGLQLGQRTNIACPRTLRSEAGAAAALTRRLPSSKTAAEAPAPSIAALVQRRSYLAQCKHRRAYDNSVLLRCMVFCCAARAPPWLGFVKSARQPVGQQCSGVMHQAAPSRGRTKRPSTMSSTMRHKTLRSLRMYCHVG